MRLSDIMAGAGLSVYAEIALIIFLAVLLDSARTHLLARLSRRPIRTEEED